MSHLPQLLYSLLIYMSHRRLGVSHPNIGMSHRLGVSHPNLGMSHPQLSYAAPT
jgi:hypothetical protein